MCFSGILRKGKDKLKLGASDDFDGWESWILKCCFTDTLPWPRRVRFFLSKESREKCALLCYHQGESEERIMYAEEKIIIRGLCQNNLKMYPWISR